MSPKNRKEVFTDGVMLNAYPDSCGGSLGNLIKVLKKEELQGAFSYFYILPSLFESDLDRGFSVISYDLNKALAEEKDLKELQNMGIALKLDFVLNHLSVQSPQFLDLLEKGDRSEFVDAFIDWNSFWDGKGKKGPEGYIVPNQEYLSKLFMRKPELPILKIPFPDGSERFYWNTFYQKTSLRLPNEGEIAGLEGIQRQDARDLLKILGDVLEKKGSLKEADFGKFEPVKDIVLSFMDRHCTSYRGQMDLNAESDKVWEFYEETFQKLHSYGAKIIRLDAFAYLHKQAGMTNFFNEPGTWEYLERIKSIADRYGIVLLPEIHSKYEEKIHEKLAGKGYPFYDFFFPGLVIDAIETGSGGNLVSWMKEIRQKGFRTVNMLGCHDGIPVLDIKGFLDESAIEAMIELIKERGGRVKDLFGPDGNKISYYQVNAAFFSALNENPQKLLLARAIQLFAPGIPEIWYLDIFAGKNDYWAADHIGHKDINRTNLAAEDIEKALQTPLVQEQLKLLRFRNNHRAFGFDSVFAVESPSEETLRITWENAGTYAVLTANLKDWEYTISYREAGGEEKVF